MSLKEKIKLSLDNLQNLMEENIHLKDYLLVSESIDKALKYTSVLSEEDKEYIYACRYALENSIEWKTKK